MALEYCVIFYIYPRPWEIYVFLLTFRQAVQWIVVYVFPRGFIRTIHLCKAAADIKLCGSFKFWISSSIYIYIYIYRKEMIYITHSIMVFLLFCDQEFGGVHLLAASTGRHFIVTRNANAVIIFALFHYRSHSIAMRVIETITISKEAHLMHTIDGSFCCIGV